MTSKPIPELTEKNKRNFWRKVNKDGPVHPYDESKGKCWLWTACKCADGYGAIAIQKKATGAHRVSAVIHGMKIPDGHSVLHSCDVRNCVNPEHFFFGTQLDNMRDCHSKGRGSVDAMIKARASKPETWARGDRNGANTHPESIPRGENRHSSKLNTKQVMEMRRLASSGITPREIGLKYGVCRTTASRAIKGQNWSHIL